MQCPKCSTSDTRVIDSRIGKNGLIIRRRRQCSDCEYRFTTIEEVVREGIIVTKRDGSREDWDRNKMLTGIRRACEKRPIDLEQMDMLISDVMLELEKKFTDDLPSRDIGEHIMAKLKLIDKIAYVRYASVYKDFRDLSEFTEEISNLKKSDD